MGFQGQNRVAVITGASSGIGEAIAYGMAEAGFRLALGARRKERLEQVAQQIAERWKTEVYIAELDVTRRESAEAFVKGVVGHFQQVNILVNNAGLARGTAHVAEVTDETDWQEMLETNVMGLLRMTRLFLPHIQTSSSGHIINIGSIAGHEAYAGGSVYCGSKFAVRAITDALRQELLGQPIRVSTIDPGMVETEFSVVRYHGDKSKADAVYAGMQPLTASDIADCVVYTATRPQHVNIDMIVVKPTDQAGAGKVARHPVQE
ncbi:SDR family NAD(P)-dependent oxidoreductase [Alicyclobacillus tolerans]|uniref:NADP-dependent 3-hydroxy acid dehydrogenase YdfG n=1 Tax=Alicyclobacillus tolerans TaxID=90970 RepID=A0ABT9LTN5_9BACL|nr:SDR family NAD(P)-dependent oxidoreductase [Alicyclobacillus tengchongensis]MDP9727621.1 NADP-dependent 3-hydroxy acid dehydrogenase YdfG [Alicyclobacillus tengchongensis]